MTAVVYTALIGGYEELCDQPMAAESALDFICFTDDPELRSDTWDVRLVEPILPMDPIRSARHLKVLGHPDLDGYDQTLWVDARLGVKVDPTDLLVRWLDGSDLTVPRHSHVLNVVTEFELALLKGLDDTSRLYEQLTHYTAMAHEVLLEPQPWTAIMARRNTPEVAAAMREWWLQLLRYSRRDQLSLQFALARTGASVRLLDLPNRESDEFVWHEPVGRSPRPAQFRVADSLQPPIAQIGQLQVQVERTVADFARAVAVREADIAKLNEWLEKKNENLANLRKRLRRTEAQLAKANARTAGAPGAPTGDPEQGGRRGIGRRRRG
jgi:hypothetical protein